MELLKFLAVFGLISAQRSGYLHVLAECTGCNPTNGPSRTDQIQISTRVVEPASSTVTISGLSRVTRREGESLPRLSTTSLTRPALCRPMPHVIEFASADNPVGFEIRPSCTRVNRCSGCCSNVFLSCQATKVVFRELWVAVQSSESLQHENIPTKVIVEEHEECECRCNGQLQCAPKADYQQDWCRCWCRDEQEAEACRQQYTIKIWDADNCSCNCREIEPCSAGLEFDYLNCECKLKDGNRGSHG